MTNTPNDLYSESYGSGKPLVLLHGYGGSTYSWRFVAPLLAQKYRVILVDLKGFGNSPKPLDQKYSVWDQADLVASFVRSLGEPEVILGGHSFGGGVALATALRLKDTHEELLTRLLLVDSISYPQFLPSFIRILKVPYLRNVITTLIPNFLQVWYVLSLSYKNPFRLQYDQIKSYARPLSMKGGHAALIETACQLATEQGSDLHSRYSEITVPTLVLWGANDGIVPLALGERLAAELPGSTLRIVEDCGHIPQEERPEQAKQILSEFLDL